MPIYEYRCDECGHQEDHLQKIAEKPLSKCPACGKKAYKKMLSAAGFQLKGSGWYATDFRDKAAAKKDAKAEPADGESKGDAKPATETTAKPTESAAKPSDSASPAPSPAPAPPPAAS